MGFFNPADYETVNERIKRFFQDHKDGRILTECLNPDSIEEKAFFKAFLYIGADLVSTGFAFERKESKGVNSDAHVENCETSAIGRALANYGYCGDKRPSREEMSKVHEKPADPEKDEKASLLTQIADVVKIGKLLPEEIDTLRKAAKIATPDRLRELLKDARIKSGLPPTEHLL